MTRSRASLWARRLDRLPLWQAWAMGLAAGVLAGAALGGFAPAPVAILGFLGLLGAAAALAWSGEPVAVAVRSVPRPSLVDLVSIPGGTFRIGSPESERGRRDDEGPIHQARLSPFECMRFPVTRRLYHQITGTDPGWPLGETDERPVTNVSWFDAVEFCNLLSEREGLTPCYRSDGDVVTWQRAANGYRLLTEAEWEYACRAGFLTPWSFGDDDAGLGRYAWFRENSSGQPQPVGRKRPNASGLYDMHGNVWEWCWDWYGPYSAAATTNSGGPASGTEHVLRGGAFLSSARLLRSATRHSFKPAIQSGDIGFRCARGPTARDQT